MLPYFKRTSIRRRPEPSSFESDLALQLRRDVEVLAIDIGPRGTFAPRSYALASEFLESALTSAGYRVNRIPLRRSSPTSWNLEASLPGSRNVPHWIVLGAHYDSVPECPAANDNASGVAGVLAVARALAGQQLGVGVRFVLFANEEPPYFNMNAMGSQEYATDCRERDERISGMVCLETIGCYRSEPGSQRWPDARLGCVLPSVGDFVAMVGPISAGWFMRRCARAFARHATISMLAAALPSRIDQVNWSDHRGFNEVGFPAFMVTDTAPFRYDHYHRATDTPEKLDYISMARVVLGVRDMIESICGRS